MPAKASDVGREVGVPHKAGVAGSCELRDTGAGERELSVNSQPPHHFPSPNVEKKKKIKED